MAEQNEQKGKKQCNKLETMSKKCDCLHRTSVTNIAKWWRKKINEFFEPIRFLHAFHTHYLVYL